MQPLFKAIHLLCNISYTPFPLLQLTRRLCCAMKLTTKHKLRYRKPKDNDNATTAAADFPVAHTQKSTHTNMAIRACVPCIIQPYAYYCCLSLFSPAASNTLENAVLGPRCQLILSQSLQLLSPCPALPVIDAGEGKGYGFLLCN